jgi:hypothetical protein
MTIFTPKPLREARRAKRKLSDKIKDMTPEERIKYVNETAQKLLEEHGITQTIYDHL